MEITSIEKKLSPEYLKSYVINYKNRAGEDRKWELVSRQGIERLRAEILNNEVFTDGTMIFATNREKSHVCMIKEFRVSAGKYVYAVPAGLSDPNEELSAVASREFKEETGLDFEMVSYSKPMYTSVGLTNERINIAYGYYSGEPSTEFLEPDEDIEVIFVDKEKAIELLKTEDVTVRSALLLEGFFKLNSFFN